MASFAKGLAAALNSYMDTKDAYHKQAMQEQDRKDLKDRQAKDDQWRDEQRDRERKNFAEADALKTRLAGAMGPVTETVPEQFGNNRSAYVAPSERSRPKLPDEQYDALAQAVEASDPMKAIQLREAANAERLKRSVDSFNKMRLAAPNLSPEQLMAYATEVVNGDPSMAHIEGSKRNPDGTFTATIRDKRTGKTFAETFKPENILSGLQNHYDQAGALAQRAAEAERNNEVKAYKPGDVLYKGGKPFATIPDRARLGGVGGMPGGSRAWNSSELQPDTGSRLDPVKTYEKIYDQVVQRNEKVKESGVGEALTDEQVAATARTLAQQSVNGFASNEMKQRKDGAIASRLAPLKAGISANPDEYAAAYQQILRKGVTAEYLTSIGFAPPKGWTGRR